MVADIQRRYGDHLYAKHDYDAAMAQYVATTGFLEPSYVIRWGGAPRPSADAGMVQQRVPSIPSAPAQCAWRVHWARMRWGCMYSHGMGPTCTPVLRAGSSWMRSAFTT